MALCVLHGKFGRRWTCGFGLSSAARMQHVLELCGHDMLRLSQFNSTAWGLNRLCAAVLGPIVASLSDAYGRVPFLLLGRVGLGCWFTGCALSTKLWHYAVTEQMTWGCLMCGWEAVESGKKTILFPDCQHKNDRFTKTGSGQPQGKHCFEQNTFSCSVLCGPFRRAAGALGAYPLPERLLDRNRWLRSAVRWHLVRAAQ